MILRIAMGVVLAYAFIIALPWMIAAVVALFIMLFG